MQRPTQASAQSAVGRCVARLGPAGPEAAGHRIAAAGERSRVRLAGSAGKGIAAATIQRAPGQVLEAARLGVGRRGHGQQAHYR
jgi:hypothetical protein